MFTLVNEKKNPSAYDLCTIFSIFWQDICFIHWKFSLIASPFFFFFFSFFFRMEKTSSDIPQKTSFALHKRKIDMRVSKRGLYIHVVSNSSVERKRWCFEECPSCSFLYNESEWGPKNKLFKHHRTSPHDSCIAFQVIWSHLLEKRKKVKVFFTGNFAW